MWSVTVRASLYTRRWGDRKQEGLWLGGEARLSSIRLSAVLRVCVCSWPKMKEGDNGGDNSVGEGYIRAVLCVFESPRKFLYSQKTSEQCIPRMYFWPSTLRAINYFLRRFTSWKCVHQTCRTSPYKDVHRVYVYKWS